MPSITRPLAAADLLVFGLAEEIEAVQSSEAFARSGRSARSLVKDGGLRVLVVGLAAGAEVAEHAVEGPALVQPLTGELTLRTGRRSRSLVAGELVTLAPGVRHSVESRGGSVFLVAIAMEGDLPLFSMKERMES